MAVARPATAIPLTNLFISNSVIIISEDLSLSGNEK
jgi:hypothetical protein